MSEQLLLVSDAVNSQGGLALLNRRHEGIKTDSQHLYRLLARLWLSQLCPVDLTGSWINPFYQVRELLMAIRVAVADALLRLRVVLGLVTITDIVKTQVVMDSTVKVEVPVNQLGALQEEIQRERAVVILVSAVTGETRGDGRELLQPGKILVLLEPRHFSTERCVPIHCSRHTDTD